MNYATLLSAAHDYIYTYNDVRRTFPHGYCLWDSTLLHSEAAQKSICHDRYEAVFCALCECAGIPQEVLIQAARIEDRYISLSSFSKVDKIDSVQSSFTDRFGFFAHCRHHRTRA